MPRTIPGARDTSASKTEHAVLWNFIIMRGDDNKQHGKFINYMAVRKSYVLKKKKEEERKVICAMRKRKLSTGWGDQEAGRLHREGEAEQT